MTRRIVVPIDASALSFQALPLVRAVYREGDEIEFLTALEPVPPIPIPNYEEAGTRWATGRHRQADGILGDDVPEGTSTIRFRPPSLALVEYLESNAPDLIVMATHGRGPVSRTWIGSTADRVIRSGIAPVLLVRPDAEDEPAPGSVRPLRRILVPLDGSRTAEHVVDTIADLLGKDIELCVITVVDRSILSRTPYLPHQVQENTAATQERKAYLKDVRGRLEADGWTVMCELFEADRPSQQIVEAAEAKGCDAIAMTTHGRGGLARIALGSVTDKVIRTSSIPVLASRPTGLVSGDA